MRAVSVPSASVRLAIAGLLLAVLAVLGLSSPAAAHDELVGSTPASGERLEAAPTEIALTYSAAIMPDGAAVAVRDAEGQEWAAADHAIDTNTLTVPLRDGMPPAGYVVEWRVVSSDGHPISGTVPFTIGDGAPIEAADVSAAPGADEEAAAVLPTIVGIVVVAAVAAIVVVLLVRRRAASTPTD